MAAPRSGTARSISNFLAAYSPRRRGLHYAGMPAARGLPSAGREDPASEIYARNNLKSAGDR